MNNTKTRQPVLYVLSSVASWVVDEGLFYVLIRLFGPALGGLADIVCKTCARVVSSFFNFNLNNRIVFRSEESYGKSMLKYYCLAVPQLAVSALLLTLFTHLLHVETPEGHTLVTIIIDGCLFVASFYIQKHWVFVRKNKE